MVIIKQTPISCPKCGEFLFRVLREGPSAREEEPLCKNCNKRTYFEALRAAGRIIMLKDEIHQKIEPTAEGEKIARKVRE